MNIFKKATKLHLLFLSSRGPVTVNDLWVMPLNSNNGFNLEAVAQAHHKALVELGETNFTAKANPDTELAELRMEIIKEVIADKIADSVAKIDAKKNAQRIAKLQNIQSDRKDDADEKLSDEDIAAELAALTA